MIGKMFDLLFGCHHRLITRPITPVHKPNSQPACTYVVCLECGKQFNYDTRTMQIGAQILILRRRPIKAPTLRVPFHRTVFGRLESNAFSAQPHSYSRTWKSANCVAVRDSPAGATRSRTVTFRT